MFRPAEHDVGQHQRAEVHVVAGAAERQCDGKHQQQGRDIPSGPGHDFRKGTVRRDGGGPAARSQGKGGETPEEDQADHDRDGDRADTQGQATFCVVGHQSDHRAEQAKRDNCGEEGVA